jgi:steroid delta-isomerase-like uncharacterized protein
MNQFSRRRRNLIDRRRFVLGLGAGGVGAVASMPGMHALADEHDSVPGPVQAVVDAFEAGDFDALVAAVSEDVVVENVAFGERSEGRDAVREGYIQLYAAFDEVTTDYSAVFGGSGFGAGEWTFRGKYTGQLEGLPPGAGQDVTIRGVDIYEYDDEFVTMVREYTDNLSFLTQMGAFDEEGEA